MTEVHFGPRALPRIDPTRAVTCRRSSAVPNERWAEKRVSGRRLTGLSVEDEIVLQFSPGWIWCWESNPRRKLRQLMLYHCATPARVRNAYSGSRSGEVIHTT